MAAPGLLDSLDLSAQRALQWSAVMAALRTEQNNSSPELVNVFDLFVGILLSEPHTSLAGVMLDHFNLQAGQLLPGDYPLPSENDIDRQMHAIEALNPDTYSNIQVILDTAAELRERFVQSPTITLTLLFIALFDEPNELRQSLESLRVTQVPSITNYNTLNRQFLEKIASEISTYQDINQSSTAAEDPTPKLYHEMLESQLAYHKDPVRIPSYLSDQGKNISLSDDLVDIRAEVDAFAYLMASRTLEPPLAIGLFGDWGSGKSFFMESVLNRVNQLVSSHEFIDKPQKEVPFWKEIVQIKFNAWQYVEGNLWASLVNHIFNQLKLSGIEDEKEQEAIIDARKKFWIDQLEEKIAELIDKKQEKASKEQDLHIKRQVLRTKRSEHKKKEKEIDKLKADAFNDRILGESIKHVEEALKPLMETVGLNSVDDVKQKVQEARTGLKTWHMFARYMNTQMTDKSKKRMILLFLLTPVVIWLLSLFKFPSLVAGSGGIAYALLFVFNIFNKATEWANTQLNTLNEVEKEINDEFSKKQKDWEAQIANEQENLSTIESEIGVLENDETTLNNEINEIRQKIDQATPANILNDFVSERAGSNDYRKMLGIPALIQNDFKKLSYLIGKYNDYCIDPAKNKNFIKNDKTNYFNRIILYIDDLDRCPDERVVDVLQAVHLLLAFKLFVVVVAVDSRWLNHALMKHYPALAYYQYHHANTNDNGQASVQTPITSTAEVDVNNLHNKNRATSEDYLEKIFQIPFWIRPLGKPAKQNIIKGLMRKSLEKKAIEQTNEQQQVDLVLGDEQKNVLSQLDLRLSPPTLDTVSLAVTQGELTMLDNLTTLMGDTPRTVKRFVNLYQLVRIVLGIPKLDNYNPGSLSDNFKLAFFLAIGDGTPKLAPILMHQLMLNENQNETFISVLDKIGETSLQHEKEKISNYLQTNTALNTALASDMTKIIPVVERFLFRTGVNYHSQ